MPGPGASAREPRHGRLSTSSAPNRLFVHCLGGGVGQLPFELGASALERGDLAKSMSGALSSSLAAGSNDGAFSAAGLGAAVVPDVTELLSADEKDEEEQEVSGGEAESTTAPRSSPHGKAKSDVDMKSSGKKKPRSEDVWFDRDSQVGAALRAHQAYIRSARKDLTGALEQLQESLEQVSEDVAGDVKNEAKMCKNRIYALKLVLGVTPRCEEACRTPEPGHGCPKASRPTTTTRARIPVRAKACWCTWPVNG